MYLHNGCSVIAVKKGWGCPPGAPFDQLVWGGTFSSHWQPAAELNCVLWGLREVDECLSLPALPLRVGLRAALLMWSAPSLGTERWKELKGKSGDDRGPVWGWKRDRERKLNYLRIQIQNTCGILSDPLGNDGLLTFIEVLLYCMCVY